MEFLIEPDDDGGYVWRALDELGSEIVVSRRLASRHACKRAILLFKVEASSAPIYDLSEAAKPKPPVPASAPVQQRAPRASKLTAIARPGETVRQRRSASSRQRP